MMASKKISCKLYFKSGDIRRISTSATVTWSKLLDTLEELYPKSFHRELRIQYLDEEGDKITVSSQAEWEYALSAVDPAKPFKLYVEDGRAKGAYFKDGPAPVPVAFYEKSGDKAAAKPIVGKSATLKKLEGGVPACLRMLFKGGKILPYNIPEYLRGCIKIHPLANNEVDIDINVFELYDALNRHALRCLEGDKAKVSEGLKILQAMRFLGEENPLTAYNEACAHSLLGSKDEAVKSLARAIEFGYKNLSHMMKDTDLDAIRDTPGYKELEHKLRPAVLPLVKIAKIAKPAEEKSKWAPQLQKLKSMGFTNEALIVPLLNKFNGNLQRVIAQLFAA